MLLYTVFEVHYYSYLEREEGVIFAELIFQHYASHREHILSATVNTWSYVLDIVIVMFWITAGPDWEQN